MKAKKVVATVAAAALLVTGSVFGTMAYLTSQDSVTNTFTVGNVTITMDEEVVDEYGVAQDKRTEEGNAYKLIPGHTYVKDPTIYLDKNSEDAWVYMGVQAKDLDKLIEVYGDDYMASGVFLLEKLCKYDGNEGFNGDWEFVNFDKETKTYYFAHKEVVSAGESVVLFDEIYLPGDEVTSENIASLDDVEIIATGYAVQKDGFDTYTDAWDKTFGKPATAVTPNESEEEPQA